MAIFLSVIITTFLISLISFAGRLTLFLKEEVLNKILLLLVSFSAGALLGGAFLHLIPEAVLGVEPDQGAIFNIFAYLIFGFCLFFILEQYIKWHHHHSVSHPEIKPFSYLILISGAIHHFIDGLIIAGSFMVSFPVGVSAAVVVALHEIPQEIGDYGILIYGGIEKIKALFLNFFSSITTILGGIAGIVFFEKIGAQTLFLLPFAAGGFIYIAAADLIPQIKQEENTKKSIGHFLVFLTGIIFMALMKLYFKQ